MSTFLPPDDQFDDELEDEDEDLGWQNANPAIQPAGSRIEIELYEGGLTVRVPPAGVWRGTSGMFLFSLIWNGAMLVFTSLMLLAFFNNKPDQDEMSWIMPVFFSLFWLAGIGLFLGSLNMGLRRAALAVVGDSLMVLQTGIFGSKQREWPLEKITSIRVDKSGMEVNDVPIMELQIHATEGGKFGMLAGRDDDELEWLAYQLNQALKLARP